MLISFDLRRLGCLTCGHTSLSLKFLAFRALILPRRSHTSKVSVARAWPRYPLKIAASDHLDDTRFRARVRTGGECGSHPLFGDLTKAVCLDERHLLIPGRRELNTHSADTPCGTWDGAGPALTEPIAGIVRSYAGRRSGLRT